MTARRTIIAGLLAAFVLVTAAGAAGVAASPADPDRLGQSKHAVMMVVYAVALFFSFLCSVAEAVVLSVSPSYVANLENEGSRSAEPLKRIKTDIDRSLAAILTLNTIAHTVGAGGAGAEAAAYFGDRYVGIAMAVLTLLILFLSEIIPKTLGAVYWRRSAPAMARFVGWLIRLMYPLIVVSEMVTNWLSRGQSVHRISREEIAAAMADVGEESGHLDAKESRILKNLFRMPSLQAADVMTPRTVMFSLQQDRSVAEVLEEHDDLGFSRIPIYGENRDDITGFVLKTDVLLNEFRSQGKAKLRDIKRELRAVEDDTPLSQVFEEMLDVRAHILLVVDHYGGTQGIVTLEDVVETLIGIEIVDEADKIDDMRRLARQKWEQRMQRLGIDVRQPDPEPPTEGSDQ